MNIKFYENLLFKIRERRSAIAGRLLDGTFENLAEYKLYVGTLKGLEEAEFITRKLYNDIYGIKEDEDGRSSEETF